LFVVPIQVWLTELAYGFANTAYISKRWVQHERLPETESIMLCARRWSAQVHAKGVGERERDQKDFVKTGNGSKCSLRGRALRPQRTPTAVMADGATGASVAYFCKYRNI
jgi:hypothetical protein